jgi:hypothetical protein
VERSGGVADGSWLGFPSRGRSCVAAPARLGTSGAQSSASLRSSVTAPAYQFAIFGSPVGHPLAACEEDAWEKIGADEEDGSHINLLELCGILCTAWLCLDLELY